MSEHVHVDGAPAPAFGLADELVPGAGAPHVHQRHQLLYASSGTLTLEVADSTWLLPPLRAAVLRAGVEHVVEVPGPASLRTVYLAPSLVGWTPPECAVFTVDPLARALLTGAVRFGPDRDYDALARSYFDTLARLAQEWVARPLALRLPRPSSPELARVLRWTRRRRGERLRAADAARAGGMAPRTLARKMKEETGLTWQRYVQIARVLRAMELLVQPGTSVTEAALDVGYSSLPTFSRVFASLAGTSPSAWVRSLG